MLSFAGLLLVQLISSVKQRDSHRLMVAFSGKRFSEQWHELAVLLTESTHKFSLFLCTVLGLKWLKLKVKLSLVHHRYHQTTRVISYFYNAQSDKSKLQSDNAPKHQTISTQKIHQLKSTVPGCCLCNLLLLLRSAASSPLPRPTLSGLIALQVP